jgi:hypothetical protein
MLSLSAALVEPSGSSAGARRRTLSYLPITSTRGAAASTAVGTVDLIGTLTREGSHAAAQRLKSTELFNLPSALQSIIGAQPARRWFDGDAKARVFACSTGLPVTGAATGALRAA